ncbi:MAG: hypothetical protein V3W11_06405 [bacterium]
MPTCAEGCPISFVVTGVGRSGTGYTAKLLTELGFPCSHEGIFFPAGEVSREKLLRGEPGPWGDASWMAPPAYGNLPDGVVVLHQVRNPVAVIRSHVGIQFFQKPNAYTEFAIAFTSTLRWHDYAIVKCMKFWVEWNRLAETAARMPRFRYHRYRLEDLCDTGKGTLAYVATLLDRAPTLADIERALAAVPRNYNSRERDRGVSWKTVPALPAKDAVLELALEYGYTAEEVEKA